MLLKGALATGTGAALLNWGNLTESAEAVKAAKRDQKHCILLWMNGGVSQFETLDMKPDRPTGGVFRPISTKTPDVQISELMPKIAQQSDKIAIIRSMKTSQVDHSGGIYLMHTGYQPSATTRFPEIGAICAKYHGQPEPNLPNFIKVSSNGNAGAGFLGPKYQPFSLDANGKLPPFSTSNMKPDAEQRRNDIRTFVEERFAERSKAEPTRMHIEAYQAARRLNEASKAFNISDEWDKNRDLYGDSLFGKRCLLARKMVESGVPFIEVGQSGYDTHADNFWGHKGKVPPMDHAWAGLLVDLEQRGLLEKTLVIWMGEIGRTPRVNNRSGRDHYVRCWSTALAGCGIKGGQAYGSSDEDGYDVKDNLVTEGDFFATIYKAMGVDPTIENYSGVRPIPLAPFGSNVVPDLLS
jgi:hypothetical protein